MFGEFGYLAGNTICPAGLAGGCRSGLRECEQDGCTRILPVFGEFGFGVGNTICPAGLAGGCRSGLREGKLNPELFEVSKKL